MKKYYLSLYLLFLTVYAFSQGGPGNGSVKGRVIDTETDNGISYATITIKNINDSSTVTGGLSAEDGNFEVTEIPFGNYQVEISFIGYTSTDLDPIELSAEQPSKDFGNIAIGVDEATLDAVIVEGIGEAVRYEIDKKVYDADKLKAAEGGTAKDVLEQIPSVTVDANQSLMLRGSSNVRVLVNGRPSSFSIQTLLEQIPQKNIQEIEIITNPSAKYDAEGGAGIINIILKENELQGFTYGFNGQWGTENKWNGGANMALRSNKWNFSTSYNYNRFRDDFLRTNLRTNQEYPDIDQLADEDRLFSRTGHFARVGIDHYFDDKNTLFISGSLGPGAGTNESISSSYDIYTRLQYGVDDHSTPLYLPLDFYTYDRFNNSENDRFGYELTTAFQHDFKANPSHNLLLDFSYNNSEEDNINDFFIDELNSMNGEQIAGFTDLDQMLDEGKNVKISADYTNPFDGKRKLELGYKSTLEDRNQDFIVRYNNTPDNYNSGLFVLNQDVHAGYFTYEQQMNETVGLKGGLRLEATNIDSEASGGQSSIYRDDYLSLFPTASASFKTGKSTQLTTSYSRRINRPGGRQLNPFSDRTDPNNRFEGNNTLRPEFTDSYELGLSKFWDDLSIDASVYHRFVSDHIRHYSEFDESTNVNTISFRNVAELQMWGAESSFNITPQDAKWFSLMVSGNYNYGKITELGSDDQLVNAATSIFSGRIMNNLNFGQGWGGQISANYQSPFDYYQGHLQSMWGINLNARKGGLFNGKGSIYLNARDIFNTFGLNIDFEDDNRTQQIELDWPSQMMFVGFNMNFGQMKTPGKRKMERNQEQENGNQPNIGM